MKMKKRMFMSVLLTLAVMLGMMLASTVVASAVSAPTTISSTSDWVEFANAVNGGHTYEGETVTLTDSIKLSTASAPMAGTSGYRFEGTFEGAGHKITVDYDVTEEYVAPFRYVKGATFKNLTVDGTIKTSAMKAAGFAANLQGNTSFISCASGVDIVSTCNGNSTHGGFAGLFEGLDHVSFVDCLFYGSISGETSTNCGGFYGWPTHGTVSFKNCLNVGEFNTKKDGSGNFEGCGTFSRVVTDLESNVTVENCYYKTAYGLEQGDAIGRKMPQEVRALLGDNWVIDNGNVIPKYVELEIEDEEDWNEFAARVNNGDSFKGKTVILKNDIAVSTMVGSDKQNSFKGVLLGCGHMITFNCETTKKVAAPFRFVDGATFVDLRVSGKIKTSNVGGAGFVGYAMGATLFDLCYSSVDIESSVDGAGTHAGFIAALDNSKTKAVAVFIDCLFSGSISGDATTDCGGFVGRAYNAKATNSVIISNSLNVGQFDTMKDEYEEFIGCGEFVRDTEDVTVAIYNSFYDTAYGTPQGTEITDETINDLQYKLGDNWKTNGEELIPKDFKYTAVVKKAPEANEMTYTGADQELVTAGEAKGGKMQYALGIVTEPVEAFSEDIPEEAEVGTYYVWYSVKAGEGYYDSDAACVEVKIEPADKDELEEKIEEAQEFYDSIKDDETLSEIAAVLEEAIEEAQAVLDKENPTQSEVDEATADIALATDTAKDSVDTAKVIIVKRLIKALPLPVMVTTDDADAIEAARDAYDDLTEEQQAMVPDAYLNRLITDEYVLCILVRAETAEEVAEVAIQARDEAIEAARKADRARKRAEKAKEEAETIAAAAVAAAIEAEQAKEEAIAAKEIAEAIAEEAVDRAEKAEAAVEAAEKAQKKAEKAAAKAEAAQQEAEEKAEAAEQAKIIAELIAEVAVADSVEAREAQAAAEAAQQAAEEAKNQAETEKAIAVAAKEAAETAKNEAVAAKKAAEEKAEAAEQAKDAAEIKAAVAETAERAAKEKAAAAETAKEEAQAAQKAAEEKATAAEAAQKAAEIAQKAAEDKATAAEAAQKAAETAQKAAEAAQKAAEQKAADAEKKELKPLAKAKLSKVKGGKKKVTVKWKKVSGANGYEIIIAKNKKGTKDARTYTVKGASKKSKVIKKLNKGKYYVKVRAYKTMNGNTVCGKFSAAKKVKVK